MRSANSDSAASFPGRDVRCAPDRPGAFLPGQPGIKFRPPVPRLPATLAGRSVTWSSEPTLIVLMRRCVVGRLAEPRMAELVEACRLQDHLVVHAGLRGGCKGFFGRAESTVVGWRGDCGAVPGSEDLVDAQGVAELLGLHNGTPSRPTSVDIRRCPDLWSTLARGVASCGSAARSSSGDRSDWRSSAMKAAETCWQSLLARDRLGRHTGRTEHQPDDHGVEP